MNNKIICPICEIEYEYDLQCPKCGRDREGLTIEDREKRPNRQFINNDYLLDLKREEQKRQERISRNRKKYSHNPFPGKTGNLKILK